MTTVFDSLKASLKKAHENVTAPIINHIHENYVKPLYSSATTQYTQQLTQSQPQLTQQTSQLQPNISNSGYQSKFTTPISVKNTQPPTISGGKHKKLHKSNKTHKRHTKKRNTNKYNKSHKRNARK